ncbi:MAG: acetylornithine deacetylase [Gammaproteobacteria bacterium]|nr:acetylornithine deacetylase [Gammaproteobacteria bacterium]
MSLQTRLLEHLARLVSFDTRNPPRQIAVDGIFAWLTEALPGFDHQIEDHGEGRISLLAVRGEPRVLFNFHLDTVPDSRDWTCDPFTLQRHEDRVIGLGACDIKGAAAAMLAAAERSTGALALLFTSDEEAGNSHCVREYVAHNRRFSQVIVAEPTRAQAVMAHRGIITGTVKFVGTAGHASAQQGIGASATHQAIAWGQQALAWAQSQNDCCFENLQGVRFNIGVIEGGIKPNMIAPTASLKFGLRSLPGMDQGGLLEQLAGITAGFADAQLLPGFVAPALNAGAGALAGHYDLPVGQAVDFWTEAALFSQAGFDTLVFGPGDIAQAHTADEWVSTEQLVSVASHYQRIISHGSA